MSAKFSILPYTHSSHSAVKFTVNPTILKLIFNLAVYSINVAITGRNIIAMLPIFTP